MVRFTVRDLMVKVTMVQARTFILFVSMFLLLNVQVNIDIVLVARITKSNEYGIGPIPCPVVVKRSQDICDCNVL